MGIVYALVTISGLAVPWQFVGNPSEKISHIIGFGSPYKLLVETDEGDFYSLAYAPSANYSRSVPDQWEKEAQKAIETIPVRKPYMKFISRPLLVGVKEVYKMQFPEVEGEYLVKFALSQDGNLWLWNYGQGGLLGLFYIIYPTVGLFFGIILALLNRAGVFIWTVLKDR